MVSHVSGKPVGRRRGIPEHPGSTSCWGIGKLDGNPRFCSEESSGSLGYSAERGEQLWFSENCIHKVASFFCLTLQPRAWLGALLSAFIFWYASMFVWALKSLLIPLVVGDPRSSAEAAVLSNIVRSQSLIEKLCFWKSTVYKACSICSSAGGLSLLAHLFWNSLILL